MHSVRLERVDEHRWKVEIDHRPLPATFASERDAQGAVAAEVARLEAVALAVLRRTRSRLGRKQP